MDNTLKRLLSLALALFMVISLMPWNAVQALATEADGGEETVVDDQTQDATEPEETEPEETQAPEEEIEAQSIDGAVAKVGETEYTDIQEAIVAAAPSGTVELLSDVTVDKWIMISQRLNISSGQIITIDKIDGLTIDGNDHTLTVKSIESAGNGNRLFYDADQLNVKDLTIEYVDAAANQGGIGLTSGTIENVTFNGGVGVYPGTGDITITGCKFNTNGSAIYNEEERDNLVVTGNTFNTAAGQYAIYLRGNTTFTNNTVITGKVNVTNSATGTISGNNFGTERFKVYNGATATISNNTINNLVFNDATVPGSTFTGNTLSEDAQAALEAVMPAYVAEVNGVKYESLQAAVDAAASGATIALLDDIALTEGVTVAADDVIILELNGKVISRNTEAASSTAAITNNGNLTIQDSVGGGKITAFAANPDTASVPYYASNTITNCGVLTVKSGTIENSTGNDARAAFPIDNNSTSRDVIVNIEGGTVSGRGAIRQFANSTTNKNEVNISGGIVNGSSYAVWMQNPNSNDNVAALNISGGEVAKVLISPSANFEPAITGGEVSEVAIWSADTTNIERNPSGFISGGTFGSDVSAFVAEGFTCKDNGDGTYGVAEKKLEGEGTEASPYLINNQDDLYLFAKLANGGDTFSGKYVKLMADIDLGGAAWTPISKFAGKLNGNEHTISNFTIDATAAHGGFFNVLEWATVEDLTLADVTATVGGYRFGTLARSINQTNIDNVIVKNVEVTTTNSTAFVAGLFTHGTVNSNMEVNNCTVEDLTVNAQNGAMMIAGITCFVQKNGTEAEGTNIMENLHVKNFKVTANDTDGYCAIGGLVGQTQSVWQNPRFNNCSVTGLDVTATGMVDVGGFMCYPGSWTYAEDCTTQGKIDVSGVTSADNYAGGFFANYGWGDNTGKGDHKLTDCSADVDIITKAAAAGGFVGYTTNSENRNKTATLTDCSASGDITVVEGGTAAVGGFAGKADRGTYIDCTASGTVTNNGTGYAAEFIGAVEKGYAMTLAGCEYTGASTELDFIGNTAEGAEITIKNYVAQIGEVKYESLQEALNAAAAGTGNVTVEILDNVDLTGTVWQPVTVSDPGYPLVTVNGNNKTITGLNDMLFAGTWAGKSGLIINDLTIKDSTIVNDENDSQGTVGVGAFIGYPQASATITLNNCHLVNSTVKGGHWTGGLIGMAGGYNGNDGPVFMNLTITGCSVTGSTITGKGSAGGVIGHGSCAAWTNVVIENTTVSGNTISSTGSSVNKAGSVMGTIGAAGQETTANGEAKKGGAFVSATVSGNTVTSGGTAITTIYGRQGTPSGTLEITGGTYDSYPIEEGVAYAYPTEGLVIEENDDGTYGVVVYVAPVAKVGNKEYKTIEAAIAAWTKGTTLTLLADVTLTDEIKINTADNRTLNLGTYTMTAAEGKNAIVIVAIGAGNSEQTTLTITADATNPGGINSGKKSIIYYKYADAGITANDRPLIYIKGGVFTGPTSSWGTAGIYTIGKAARQCATLNISGGTFNCSINGSGKSKMIISGGTFNYSVGSQGDSTCYRLISGGKFKSFGFMTADAANKFGVGSALSNYDKGVYVDDEGYLVVGGPVITEPGTTYEASTAYGTWNSYLKYSSAANGLYWTSVEAAMAKKTSGTVNVYVDELDMTGINFKGTIVSDAIVITFAEGTTPAWTVAAATEGLDAVYTETVADGVVTRTYKAIKVVAKIGETPYESLAAALTAAQEGDTITVLAGTIEEGTIKMPASLKNVTIKGEEGAVLKDMTLMAHDGNTLSYVGLTIDGVVFDNSRISITGWRTGAVTVEDLKVINCTFKNLNDTTNSAPVHINMDADEAVKNFTFSNNVIDGATGGSKSGVYAQLTGEITFTDNVINNVSFRPYVIQITTDDGIADNFVVTGNTFSGSAAGRAQGLGNNNEGTDTVNLVVSGNIFKGITSAQQICYWNFNEETTTADLSKNYYDIDVEANANRFYYNSAAKNAEDLIGMGIYPYYADEAMTTLVTAPAIMITNADGSVEYYGTMAEAVPYTTNCPRLEGATVKLLKDIEAAGIRMMENDMVLDLNDHTYTIVAGTGSQGTNTSGFQIRPEVTTVATIKNGTIKVAEGAPVVWMFNNYATNFVVENVTVDCTNMAYSYGESCYVSVSRAGDNVQFTGTTNVINFNSEVAGNAINVGDTMTIADTVIPGGSIELDGGAVLTAPAGLDVVTADGYKVVYANGVYTSVQAVAQIGNAYYESLAKAVEAAQAGETVTVLKNIELTESITVPAGKTIVLDLNGKTITSAVSTIVVDGGELTVKDSGTDGKIISTDATGSYEAIAVKNNGKLTLESGTVESGLYGIYAYSTGGHIVMNGGTVNAPNMAIAVGAGSASITGGTLISGYYIVYDWEKGLIDINGGLFSQKPNAAYIVEDYGAKEVTVDGATWYQVVELDPVAKIGDIQYKTIKAALAAWTEGDVIELLSDVTIDALESSGYGKAGVVVKGQVIDGKGYTLTVNGANGTWDCGVYITGGTVKNLTVKGSFRGVFTAGTSADICLDNVKFENVVYTFSSDAGNKEYGVYISNSTLNGWTSYTDAHKEVVFTNCTFGEGNGNAFCRPYNTTIFDGCTFGAGYTIDGSQADMTFKGMAAEEAAALIGGAAAMIESGNAVTFYPTLAEAIEAAEATGETVYLKRDVVLKDTLVIKGNVTLNMKGYTISQEKACTESYEMIRNKGNLTITGNGKISFTDTGAGDPNFGWGSYTIRNEGTLVVENGTIEHLGAQAFATHMICAIFQYSGSTTINGGTISTPAYRSMRLWKGDMTINGGNFEGQVWVQAVDNSSALTVNGGSFAPCGNDASSIFVSNASYDVKLAVTDGIFNGKIGVSNASKLAGAITGGLFSEAAKNGTSTTLLGEDLVFSGEANADGLYAVREAHYVAEVGGVKYESLAEAAKAIATDGSDTTIKILKDIELAESIVFDYGTGKVIFEADTPVTIKQTKVGLDLDFSKSSATPIVIGENVTFEIYDNASGMYLYYGPSLELNGTITGGQNWGVLYLFQGEHNVSETGKIGVGRIQIGNTTLDVKGEVDTNYLLVENSTFTADGATVDANVIYDNNNGSQRWGASEFNIVNGSTVNTSKLTLSYAESALTIDMSSKLTATTITGAGKIVIDAANYVSGNTSPIVGNASTFTGTLEVINNKDVVASIDENGNIVLSEKVYVAQIGETKYESLQAAIDAAATSGDPVYLLKDVTLSETITVPAGESFVLNLKGKTITAGWADEAAEKHIYAFTNNGSMTITGSGVINTRGIYNYGKLVLGDVTVNAIDHNGGYGVANYAGSEFILNGGTVAATNENGDAPGAGYDATPIYVEAGATATFNTGKLANNSNFTAAILNEGTTIINNLDVTSIHTSLINYGTMTIEGGKFTCDGLDGVTAHALWAASGTTTINGGTFDGKDNFNGFNVDAAAGAVVNITGGTFLNVHSGSLYGEGTIAVSGGTFFDEVPAERCAEGYVPTANTDGTYTVTKRTVSGEVAYRAYINDSENREAIQVDLLNVYAEESLVIELYDANGNMLTTTSLKKGAVEAESYTANIVLWGNPSSSWTTDVLVELTTENVPETIKLYADGILVDTYENALGAGSGVDETAKYLALDVVKKPVETVVAANGLNLRLQDLLKLGFYFGVTTEEEIVNAGALLWTAEQYAQETDYTVNSAIAKQFTGLEAVDGSYAVETDGIYAQYLDTVYYFRPYVETESGIVYGNVVNASALTYANIVYNGGSQYSAELKSLVIDLLNYATAARTFFCYDEGLEFPNQTFNSILSDADKVVNWAEDMKAGVQVIDESDTAFNPAVYGVNTNLLEAISLNMLFKDGEGVEGMLYWTEADYKASTVHDATTATGDLEILDGGAAVYGAVEGIYAFQMYNNFYFRAYDAQGNLSKTYCVSVASYLTTALNQYAGATSAEDLAFVDLIKAMMVYGTNAKSNPEINKG